MNRKEAISFVRSLISKIGHGYHPDNHLSDYVNRHRHPSFTDSEVETLQPKHEQACAILGDDVYTIALIELAD